MSQLNNIDNFNLPERSGLCETENFKNKLSSEEANNFDPTVNNKEVNDEFILSLLNSTSDSDGGRGDNESLLNNSGGKAENITIIPNVSETASILNYVQQTDNKQDENSDNVLNNMKCGQHEIKNVNTSIEEQKLAELKVTAGNDYRHSDSSWSEDEDSSSSSSDSDILFDSFQQSSSPKVNCVKTKGELDIEDLPPIEYLKISVGEEDLKKVGKVHAVVFKLVVVQATKDEKPLDIDSVLFLAPNEPLGRIFEVFGPVLEPFYTILFNAPEDITDQGVKVGSEVFFAPHKNEITSYVFVDMLRQQKGSDASWKDNNEPPDEHLDYSDDEQERTARLKRRGKGRVRETEEDDEVQIIPYKISPNEKRTFNYTSYTRNNSCDLRNPGYSAQNNRNSIQNSRNSVQNNGSNLDNVPVWISTPPSYLEPRPLPTQSSVTNIPPVQPFQLKQPASLQIQHQSQPLNASLNSSQTQSRPGTLMLNPKQPYVPRQPSNVNSQRQQRQSFHRQSPPPNENARYYTSPQRLQMQQNAPRPMYFQNINQHVFGQITPVSVMSPAPPMSPAIFSPCPSPAMYVSPNAYSLPSPALSPNPFWHPQNQHSPSFTNVRICPPPTTPLTIQIPTFSGPPIVRFSAPNNCSVPPPPHNFSTPPPYQYSSRY